MRNLTKTEKQLKNDFFKRFKGYIAEHRYYGHLYYCEKGQFEIRKYECDFFELMYRSLIEDKDLLYETYKNDPISEEELRKASIMDCQSYCDIGYWI